MDDSVAVVIPVNWGDKHSENSKMYVIGVYRCI